MAKNFKRNISNSSNGSTGSNMNIIFIIILLFIIVLLTIIAVKINNKVQKCPSNSSSTMKTVVQDKEPLILIDSNIDEQRRGFNVAENSTAPVYPEQDPRYPLRKKNIGYQQVGVLVSNDLGETEPVILPLFGRKMSSRDRWNYYCASDKYHMWKLPVLYKNRDCQADLGCDEIYDGDDVTVPDYANKVFRARIYKYSESQVL